MGEYVESSSQMSFLRRIDRIRDSKVKQIKKNVMGNSRILTTLETSPRANHGVPASKTGEITKQNGKL